MISDEKRAKIEAILYAANRKISPSKEEKSEEERVSRELVLRLEKELKGKAREARIHFVGSSARNTGLKGDRDLDMFIAFPKSMKRGEIVSETQRIAKALKIKWEMHYAEHPYLRGCFKGFEVELIPCFQIGRHEQLKSAVDRSPLHMEYLQEKLSDRQKRDIRAMKKFMRAAGVYGAELEVGGFSGLVVEMLVLHYGSFVSVLEASANWKFPVVVDVEKYYLQKELLEKFPDSALIIVDAVDKNRNAAAAITRESASKFVSASDAFLKRPGMNFFFPKEKKFSASEVGNRAKKRGTAIVVVSAPKPDIVHDILVPQLRRSLKHYVAELEKEGFSIVGAQDFAEEKRIGFLLEAESEKIGAVKRLVGPHATMNEDADKFVKKHGKPERGPFIEGTRVVVDEKRRNREIKAALKELLGKRGFTASKLEKPMKTARISEKVGALGKEELDALGKYLFKREHWF